MWKSLPDQASDFMEWRWSQIEPFFQELAERPIDGDSIGNWLADWTQLIDRLSETHARLSLAVNQDTTNTEAEARYNLYLDTIYPTSQAANQRLKERILDSGLEPAGFEIPLRRMRAEAAIFRKENLPLLTEEHKLSSQYNKIIGAQTVTWEGEELTLQKLRSVYQRPDRSVREQAWRLAATRQLADRETLNHLWSEFGSLRRKLAENAGAPDYRSYRWQQMVRLDYTPEDCLQFQKAIEQVVVPAATRLYEGYRQRLGVDHLRPWDLDLDLHPHLPPLPPYGDIAQLGSKVEMIFQKLNPLLGDYYHIMRSEGLLDLDNRKGKAPGGSCTSFSVARRPFIFMNAIGLASDIRTLLHESGHAFHNFERLKLPYAQQRIPGLEFAEVASMSMELLTFPYIAEEQGGFYPGAQAKQFCRAHLEHVLTFWPYMAVVDAFQHWVYTNQDLAKETRRCDEKWLELWGRFLPGVDWSGLEDEAMTGWQRKQHIFRSPFYYVEYGLAQLGAVQVWRNALLDPEKALQNYRHALSLGGTVTLPELYQAAGAKLAFDADTLKQAVDLVESTIAALD